MLRYIVQRHIQDPHPDRWISLNDFDTLISADIEADNLRHLTKDQRPGCDGYDVYDEYRVVPTIDTEITLEYKCLGPIFAERRACRRTDRVWVPWLAGHGKPYHEDHMPAGWGKPWLCPHCTKVDREQLREDARVHVP